jgi:hypothetical protein
MVVGIVTVIAIAIAIAIAIVIARAPASRRSFSGACARRARLPRVQ